MKVYKHENTIDCGMGMSKIVNFIIPEVIDEYIKIRTNQDSKYEAADDPTILNLKPVNATTGKYVAEFHNLFININLN